MAESSPDGRGSPHRFPVSILASDIDFMGHVNNAIYLNWVQAAVIDHWRKLAPPEAVATRVWVALRHEITYRRPAFAGDQVIVTVLLERVHGARAFYQSLVRRGEELLADVRSCWCCLDASTMRPARLGRALADLFLTRDQECRVAHQAEEGR
jgi:acyl-CoA thioester hydrolase